MKMLALLAGELQNSAKYFSTFANVNKANCQKSMALLEQVMITPDSHGSTRHAGVKVAKEVRQSLAEKTVS